MSSVACARNPLSLSPFNSPPPKRRPATTLPWGAGVGTGLRGRSYWASRALSLSSFPHSQSFPGSTAKCRGNSLCSESVRGITAETEERERYGGRQLPSLQGDWQPPQTAELWKRN